MGQVVEGLRKELEQVRYEKGVGVEREKKLG